jgi:alpha-L-rhamnosidase
MVSGKEVLVDTLKLVLGSCALCWIIGTEIMADVMPRNLRCEYLTNPLAVDAERPRLSWTIDADGRNVRQSAYQILVAGSETALKNDQGDLWDSGNVKSDQTAQIEYGGKPLTSGREVYWKVRVWTADGRTSGWSAPAAWRMGFPRPEDWKAKWVSAADPLPEGVPTPPQPSPYFRTSFPVDKAPARAILTVSALGLYEIRINGQGVFDRETRSDGQSAFERLLAPEWTNYHKRIQYQAYDVTVLMREGQNSIAAILGEGWYAGRIGISHIVPDGALRNFYGRKLALLAQLDIAFADGTTQTIATDETWKAMNDGPIVKACILDGEVYDARKRIPGWDLATFQDSAWKPVEVIPPPRALLVAQPDEPVRITAEIAPVKETEPKPGVFIFDFGQILSGACRIKVRGPAAGATVTLRHAEMLAADGTLYRDNLRMDVYRNDKNLKWGKYLGARQEDQFILRGEGDEIFMPRFTYHGFRYVEVTGLPERGALKTVTALAFHSAPPMTGSFECSSPLLNRLMQNITWTQRDNMHSVPTDCPQRDERLGWMGDMLVFAQPACFIMDMAGFFTKWAQDIRDAQADDGRYPDVAPHPYDPNARFSGVPAWGDAGVVVPWRMYVNYGDTRVLEKHFDSARRWVDWIHANNPDLLWKKKRNNDYGDWLNGDTLKLEGFGFPKGGSEVPKEVFATAFFQHSTSLVAKMAAAINRPEEAKKYAALADGIRAAFVRAYVKENGEILGNTQAGYALALGFDLLPEKARPEAVRRMVQRIRDYKDHISTGFHSTIHLMNELTRYGQNDVAYQLINNTTIPSWGYTIEQGATTIWERWDGYVAGRGFQDPGMNSFCHYAIGSVGEWMYRTILGINPDERAPGYRHFTLRPRPGGGLTWAKGRYDSLRGRISSEWKIEGDGTTYAFAIPANTTATVSLPATDPAAVTEGGRPASSAEGVRFIGMEGGAAVYEVGSGSYRFVVKK